MGIDDVRDLLHYERPVGSDGKKRYLPLEKLPTYLSQKTLDSLSRQFYYISKDERENGRGGWVGFLMQLKPRKPRSL